MATPNPIHIVPVEGFGAELQKAIQPLVENYQRSEQLRLQEEELKLRKAQLTQQQAEREAAARQQGEAGQALQQLLALQDQQQVPASQVPFTMPMPFGLGTALGGPSGPPTQMLTGMGPMASVFARIPATAVPQAVELSRDIRTQILKEKENRSVDAALASAVSNARPEQQDALKNFIALKRGGIDLPANVVQGLYPNLFPAGVDPALMNTALRFGVAGGLSWGDIRHELGIPQTPGGIPDDFTFPQPSTGTQKQSDLQARYSIHAGIMTNALRDLDGYTDASGIHHPGLVEQTGGLNMVGSVKRAFDVASQSGNSVTAFFGSIARDAANGLISQPQRALLNANWVWANSAKYLMTGAQSNAQELAVLLSTSGDLTTDDPATHAQKLAFRQTFTEAINRVVAGTTTRVQALDSLIGQTQDPKLKQLLQSFRTQAQANGNTVSANGGAPALYTQDPADINQMTPAQQTQMILDAINAATAQQTRSNLIFGH